MEEWPTIDRGVFADIDDLVHPWRPALVHLVQHAPRLLRLGREHPVEWATVGMPGVHTDTLVAVPLASEHLAVFAAPARPESDCVADVCVLWQGGDLWRDRDLRAVDAVVYGSSGGEQRADARVGTVRADEHVGDHDETVGKGQLVLARAILEQTDGREGMAPLDRILGDGSEAA